MSWWHLAGIAVAAVVAVVLLFTLFAPGEEDEDF